MSDKTQERPSDPAKQPAKKAAPTKPEPIATAGGYVDRGDGLGWVLADEGE